MNIMTNLAAVGPRRRILMLCPYRARDLDGLALVAYFLEKRYGQEVIFSNGYRVEQKLLELAPDAVVMDHLLWDFKAREAKLAKSLGMKLIVLPTEGLHRVKEEARVRAGKPHGVSGLVDCHFAWGDYVRDALLEERLAEPERIHTVGCPRFDFYAQPYSSLLPSKADFLKPYGITNPGAPLILWATNTTYAARDQEDIIRRHAGRGKYAESELRDLLHDEKIQFREHTKLVLSLAKAHPDWNFLIKVHPAEWIKPYVELVRSEANLHLAFDAPIRGFLYYADVLLQRGCTTSTEAWMLGKPVIELEVGSYNIPTTEDQRAGSEVVTTIDEADAAIRAYLSGRPISTGQQTARDAFLKEFCYRIDGKAAERCAAIIHATVCNLSYTEAERQAMQTKTASLHANWKRTQARRLPNRLKDAIGIPRHTSLRFWKKLRLEDADGNLGLLSPEIEITRAMVEERYCGFDRILPAAALTCPASSVA